MTVRDSEVTITALEQVPDLAPQAHAVPAEPIQMGTIVGRFSILECVGAGGLGEVFAAYDPDLDRKVALKFLRTPETGLSPAQLSDHTARLLREAQALAKARHPNIATVYEVGTNEGRVFIAMEFVRGETVAAWSRRRERHWTEVRDVMLPAGEALAALHASGLVHRDFKPQNIMVEPDGRVVVLDFGLTRAGGPRAIEAPQQGILLHEDLTGEGALAGTLPYMAPELLRGGEGTPATDVFAFCVTLYEAVFGARPFIGKTIADYQRAIDEGASEMHDARVPRWLRSIVTRGLSPDPAARFGSMNALLVALRRSQTRRRWRVLAGVAVVALSVGVGALVTSAFNYELTQEQIERLEDVAGEARQAAAQGHYIVPPVDDPEGATALARILELEAVQGPQAEASKKLAAALRQELAQALVELGDDYNDKPGGEGFAGDFYAAALLFDPNHEEAREKAPVTIAQLAALERAAATGEFSPAQRVAYEPMTILADEEPGRRAKKVAALRKRNGGLPASTREQLRSVLSGSGQPIPLDPVAQARPPSTPAEAKAAAAQGGKPEEVDAEANKDAAKAVAKSGREALSAGNFEQAEQKFHRALRLDRRNRIALEGLADIHFQRGRYSEAASYAKQALRQAPKNARLHLKLGDAYYSVLRYDDALAAYRSAAKLGLAKARDRVALVEARLGGDTKKD